MTDAALKILIADDHAIFRRGLVLTLERLDCAVLTFEAETLPDLLDLIDRQDAIGIVILDLQMPGMTDFTGLTVLRRRLPQTPILILSASESAEDVFGALAAGASGYIAKSAGIGDLFDAIRTVRAGGVFVPRALLVGAPALAPERAVPVAPPPASRASPGVGPGPGRSLGLTPRQAEVLALVVEGHANKEIGFRLAMSEGTVKAHVAAIMRHLGARNRVQILRAAEEAGLVPPR